MDVASLSRQYGPMVLRRCRQLLRDEDEALDATQDVFVRVIERRRALDARYASSLLYRIATNVCLNRMGQEILVGTAPLFPLIAIGMLLTAAGIYGVLAFSITRRSKELAVRVAIGATGRDVIRLVTSQSLRLVALGCTLGVAVTFVLARVVRASGGAGTPYDPSWPIFAIPVLIIVGIGALATWIPSRRALKINPASLLRTV